jgi:23S rRNA (uracil1939-C5)-methyltransferase
LTQLSIRELVPQIEVSVADNAVALVLRVLARPAVRIFGPARLRDEHGVRLYLQEGGLDSVRRLTEVPLEEPLRYALPAFALELEFAPTDFIQVNREVNEALVAARSSSSIWMSTPGCSICTAASAISPWRSRGARARRRGRGG